MPQLPESQRCPYEALPPPGPQRETALADQRCKGGRVWNTGPVGRAYADDGTNLALLTGAHGDDLAKAQAVLRAGGIVVPDPDYVHDGRVDLLVQRPDAGPGKDGSL